MFKLTKKKKLQEIENDAQNDKIAKSKQDTVNPESIFPSASTTLEITLKDWKHVKADEILKKIKYESAEGFRHADFYHSTISEELVNELRAQGYRVEVYEATEKVPPYFNIYW